MELVLIHFLLLFHILRFQKKHKSLVKKKVYQMKGHLKSIMLNTSQETWKLDLPDDPAPGAQGQPQGPPSHVPITTSHIAPPFVASQSAPILFETIKNVQLVFLYLPMRLTMISCLP
jgi:hypothetical protein